MKSVLCAGFAAIAAIAVVPIAIATRTAHAQSAQAGAVATPPMGNMMHDQPPPAISDHQPMHGMGAEVPSPIREASDDPRLLVSLPVPMREHMLASMRDHLATLSTVMGDIADANFDVASKLLEERLGMSSLPLHHAAEMAPNFPQPMQNAGTSMHHAASRLALVLQNASVAQTFDSMREVNAALHEVTTACVACHAAYRLR